MVFAQEYHQGQSDSSLIREPLKFNPRPGEKKSFDSVMVSTVLCTYVHLSKSHMKTIKLML